MLLISQMVRSCIFCGTVSVCPLSPYHDNDMTFWILLIAWGYAFVALTNPENLDLSFTWGHCHLDLVDDRPPSWLLNFLLLLHRADENEQVERAIHGCNSWLSVWTLSSRCPVKLSAQYQSCFIVIFLTTLPNVNWVRLYGSGRGKMSRQHTNIYKRLNIFSFDTGFEQFPFKLAYF